MDSYYFDSLREDVARALAEDRADHDITADLIPAEAQSHAEVITREEAIVCGKPWVSETFQQVDSGLVLTWHSEDGDEVAPGSLLFEVKGSSRSLLTAERTALNFLQTLSGTATASRRYARLVDNTPVMLLDTRKTLPGLRRGQKYAVKTGGCSNHRRDLNEAFLIKENHIAACGSISEAIRHARKLYPDRRLEIEVENLAEFDQALAEGPDWIMLDNFSLSDLETAVRLNKSGVKLEASGSIETESDLQAIAVTGVDYISIGALTKHLRAIDLSMRLLPLL